MNPFIIVILSILYFGVFCIIVVTIINVYKGILVEERKEKNEERKEKNKEKDQKKEERVIYFNKITCLKDKENYDTFILKENAFSNFKTKDEMAQHLLEFINSLEFNNLGYNKWLKIQAAKSYISFALEHFLNVEDSNEECSTEEDNPEENQEEPCPQRDSSNDTKRIEPLEEECPTEKIHIKNSNKEE